MTGADKLPVYLTTAQAAKILGYSVASLRKWRNHGKGPPFVKINGTSVRYELDQLLSWIKLQKGASK